MVFSRIIHKISSKLKKIVKEPVYIPVMSGNLLCGKTILITGGTGGIGIAIAQRCIDNGAKVIIAGRNSEKLDKLAETIDIIPFQLDIVNFDTMQTVFNNLIMNHKIDVLINCAGVQFGLPFGNTGEDDFDRTLDTNLKGTYFFSQIFSNYLISNGIKGNILNISSVSGNRPAISPYMLSKWGIMGLTQGMAKKLIKHGIVVNGIAPGPVATNMLCLKGDDLAYEKSPAGRYADPVEVANLSVVLVSDLGRMVVGDTIFVSGGCGNLTFDDLNY